MKRILDALNKARLECAREKMKTLIKNDESTNERYEMLSNWEEGINTVIRMVSGEKSVVTVGYVRENSNEITETWRDGVAEAE